jgi:hypothetical protein
MIIFLCIPDPHPDPLVTSKDPAPEPAMDPAPEPSVDPDPLAINLRLLHDFLPVFRIRIQIRIHRIHLAIPDPHPDPLVREEFIRGSFMIRIRSKMSRIPNSALKNDVNVPSKEISIRTKKSRYPLDTYDECKTKSKVPVPYRLIKTKSR